ncbi:MAG TPA: hypothetical protein DEQ77_00220 [Candidatus Omnitrophica bacterium]|nr:hypothetical protein [Candidatus Omnitrophota bacterium]
MTSLSILPLKAGDAPAFSRLLKSDGDAYGRFFQPFAFDVVTLKKILLDIKKDKYWGIYSADTLIGFFMLRGLDAGFDIPSYGVYIAKEYAGKGVSRLTLQFVEVWGKLNNIQKVMIKVHPENHTAKRIYEKSGAVPAGIDPKNANLVYFLSIR